MPRLESKQIKKMVKPTELSPELEVKPIEPEYTDEEVVEIVTDQLAQLLWRQIIEKAKPEEQKEIEF